MLVSLYSLSLFKQKKVKRRDEEKQKEKTKGGTETDLCWWCSSSRSYLSVNSLTTREKKSEKKMNLNPRGKYTLNV